MTLDTFRGALRMVLTEMFEDVHGIFLDRNTSFFETLESVSAEEASRPVADGCASIAAQVEHTRFYLEMVVLFARGEVVQSIDWQATWQLTTVTPGEWETLKGRLRDQYQQIRSLVDDDSVWMQETAVQGALGMVAHTAYHLGEIRRSLCTVQR